MTDVTFGGIALSTAVPEALVTLVRRQLVGARRDNYVDVPGRDGSWFFGDRAGDRSTVVSINLWAEDLSFVTRRDAVNRLARWCDSSAQQQLMVDDESDRYWLAKLSSASDPAEWLYEADLDLTFLHGPYAYAVVASSEAWAATDSVAHAWSIEDDVDALPVVEVTAGADMTGFVLTTNGVVLTYETPLASGDKVTINSLAYMVTNGPDADTNLTGYFDPADVSMAGVDGDFPRLVSGSNTMTIDTPAGQTASITVSWRRRYRG